jgi:hypothetical protein
MSYPVRTLTREWLMSRVYTAPNSGCWIWAGAIRPSVNYGKVLHDRKWKLAHRISWELFNGPIPNGMFVLHKCDFSLCVNPSHLFIGSHTENMRDMQKKGRHPRTKLTENLVEEIRESSENQYAVADRYGVSQPTISAIRNRKSWCRDSWRNY